MVISKIFIKIEKYIQCYYYFKKMCEDEEFLKTMTYVCQKIPIYMLYIGIILIPIENSDWFYNLFEKYKQKFFDNIEYILILLPILSILLLFSILWYDPFNELDHSDFLPTCKHRNRTRKIKEFEKEWGQFVETEK